MKKIGSTLGYILLFCGSLLFFVMLLFPYEILKEAVSNTISESTGFQVHISDMSVAFPVGIELENVHILLPNGSQKMEVKSMEASMLLFSLLKGAIGVEFLLVNKNSETLKMGGSLPILSLINGAPSPDSVFLKSAGYTFDDIVAFLLDWKVNDPSMDPMLLSLLSDLEFTGKLKTDIELDINSSNVVNSSGKLNIDLLNSMLKFKNADFAIKDQKFAKASIKGILKTGSLEISPSSGLLSDGLEVDVSGKLKLNQNINATLIEGIIGIKLKEEIKENYGILLDTYTQKTSGGELKYKFQGTLGSPNFYLI